jgi:hypothetical protein
MSPRSSTSSFALSAARLASNVDEPVSHYRRFFLQLPDDTSAAREDTMLLDVARRKNKNNASYSCSQPTPLRDLHGGGVRPRPSAQDPYSFLVVRTIIRRSTISNRLFPSVCDFHSTTMPLVLLVELHLHVANIPILSLTNGSATSE